MPKSTESSLSQKGWCNKPTKLQFQSIRNIHQNENTNVYAFQESNQRQIAFQPGFPILYMHRHVSVFFFFHLSWTNHHLACRRAVDEHANTLG